MDVNIINPLSLRGSSGRKLLAARRDPATGRIDLRGLRTPAIVVNGAVRNNALLTRDEWVEMDNRIIPIAQYEMNAVMDLVDAGLVHNLGGIGTTISQWQAVGDTGPANVAMNITAQGSKDLQAFEYDEVPIPIIFKDVEIDLRQLEASRRMGSDIDLTNYDEAARQVGIACERMLLHGYSESFLGKAIYGYTTHPNRTIVSGFETTPFNITTAEDLILGLLREARLNDFRGPFNLYIPSGYDTELFRRFNDGSAEVLDDWMKKVTRITSIKENDLLEDGNMVLVQMQSNTVDLAVGFALAPIEWETMGGMVENTRVLTAQAPRLKKRKDGKMGVMHMRFQPSA